MNRYAFNHFKFANKKNHVRFFDVRNPRFREKQL